MNLHYLYCLNNNDTYFQKNESKETINKYYINFRRNLHFEIESKGKWFNSYQLRKNKAWEILINGVWKPYDTFHSSQEVNKLHKKWLKEKK